MTSKSFSLQVTKIVSKLITMMVAQLYVTGLKFIR